MNELECGITDFGCIATWLQNEYVAYVLWLYDWLFSGIAFVLESIPVPDFMLNVGTFQIPSGVAWAASMFQLDYGLVIIVSSYTARFLLRRIPFVG
ncbi:hypothetical protein AYJ58_13155 [Shewanella sp. Pdp11]|uniref:hypothetical protein n=1 Tax=Shewanella sp. Pdp11 TaxID=2059264 RepID=UPI000CA107EF|nr:hypothetical protein [Shewanella sp. Pdp11]AUD60365.1 hypothetical protein AYJ58_13110 [Shewanella sp. Pdp11]AUD60373.1 hypothetical protein AYJ58_13155 [Shewanella sp. Pdp11]